jgi:moderate conductance mechanosensitive channel
MSILHPSCESKQIVNNVVGQAEEASASPRVKNGKIHNGQQNYQCRDCIWLLKFWLIAILTLGLICITSPLIAQTDPHPTDPQSSSTSITAKDTPSFFDSLSRLANFAENPPTEWIWFDGRRLFQVTALKDYLPKRVEQIKTNLEQISSAYFQSDRHELRVNGSPTIEINGQYLLTVTKLDAELLGIDPATWAKQLGKVLREALIRAKQERQPQFLQHQGVISLAIMLTVSIVNWLLTKLRWRIHPSQVSNSALSTADTATKKQYQKNFQAIEERLLFYFQITLWLGGIIGCLNLFPYTRPVQVWLLSGLKIPLKVGLIILGTYLTIRLSHTLIDRFVSSIKVNPLLSPVASERSHLRIATIFSAIQGVAIVAWIIIGLFVGLIIFGVDFTPLIAGAGLLGVALSLAAQNLLKDTINGFLIVLEDQYGIGDIIDTGTWSGVVEGLNLRITQLRNPEGKLITIPNSQIGAVANLTKSWSRVDLNVPIDYETDTLTAIKIIETTAEEMSRDPQWRWQIIEAPRVMGVDDFSDRGLIIKIWIKTQPAKQWMIAREFRLRLKLAFDQAGISISVLQQNIAVRDRSKYFLDNQKT